MMKELKNFFVQNKTPSDLLEILVFSQITGGHYYWFNFSGHVQWVEIYRYEKSDLTRTKREVPNLKKGYFEESDKVFHLDIMNQSMINLTYEVFLNELIKIESAHRAGEL